MTVFRPTLSRAAEIVILRALCSVVLSLRQAPADRGQGIGVTTGNRRLTVQPKAEPEASEAQNTTMVRPPPVPPRPIRPDSERSAVRLDRWAWRDWEDHSRHLRRPGNG